MKHSAREEIAVSFLEMASSGKVGEAYERYVHPDFIHHNPYFKGDRESLRSGMEASAVQFPDKAYEAVHVLEDGDFVAVHGRIRLAPGTPEYVLVHIFRFEGDRIAEEWEASQEVPEKSLNTNGAF